MDTTQILMTVLAAVGGAGMWLLKVLLSDVLTTNKDLRSSLARMGERQADTRDELRVIGEQVDEIHERVADRASVVPFKEARAEIHARETRRRLGKVES